MFRNQKLGLLSGSLNLIQLAGMKEGSCEITYGLLHGSTSITSKQCVNLCLFE